MQSFIRCNSVQFADLAAEPGQVVYVVNDDGEPGQLKMWTGTEWQEIKADTNSEIRLTAYDMNK